MSPGLILATSWVGDAYGAARSGEGARGGKSEAWHGRFDADTGVSPGAAFDAGEPCQASAVQVGSATLNTENAPSR